MPFLGRLLGVLLDLRLLTGGFVLLASMLSGHVWLSLNTLHEDLPRYGFYVIRDLRFAYSDLASLDATLEVLHHVPVGERQLTRLAEKSDLLYVRFDTFRQAEKTGSDGRAFEAIVADGFKLVDSIDGMAADGLPVAAAKLRAVHASTRTLFRDLGDYVRDSEAQTDRAIQDQASRFTWIKIQIVASLLLLSALAGFILVLLSRVRRASDAAHRAVVRDTLTGLANRRGLAEWSTGIDAERSTYAVLVVDVDDFKLINDRCGHGTGDAVLRAAADWLRAGFAEDGIVARWGGDEFVAIVRMGSVHPDTAESRLHAVFADPPSVPVDHETIRLSFSCGVALWPTHAQTITEAMQCADIALYEAKERGKNRLVFYERSQSERRHRAATIATGLARALRNGDLTLFWQPQVDSFTKRAFAAEALLRWHDRENGVSIPPSEFIPIAERSDLILDLDCFVMDEACRTCAAWTAAGTGPDRVAVNISPRHFHSPHLLDHVRNALSRHRLRPDQLELEITEGLFLQDSRLVSENLEALSGLGVRLALDDFGTGYSNVAYLNRLRPDLLKIDRSFLRGSDRETGRSIVTSMVRLAESLGSQILAEGVETEEELRFLNELGCSLVQGYLFARPMPAEAIPAWMAAFEQPTGVQSNPLRANRG